MEWFYKIRHWDVSRIKNRYEVREEETVIFIDRPDGDVLEVIIDTEDLEKVQEFPNTWGATRVGGNRWQIKGKYKGKNTALSRFITDVKNSSPARFRNSNQLDHRRSNLTVGYGEQIKKGNEYEIKDGKAYITLRRQKGEPLVTIIDAEDLERVLEKGTWFAEWHKDFDNYLVQTVCYDYIDGKKHRKKMTLHSYIMGTENQEPIRHSDENTLNNSKSNLKIHGVDMMNDHEVIDDKTVAIILRDKYGEEKDKTLIDKEDFARVNAVGYTWFYFQGNGYPYAVSNLEGKRIYLHRFIMNTPEGMVVDHLDHQSLDNRKQNLKNVTIDENQQNRIGPRKGSKSGIRGVSWDETHQDWIVDVKGYYIKRTKDLELAEELAKKNLEELMPYLNNIKKNS